jgi:uncharacterized protein (TIRG00374 family)
MKVGRAISLALGLFVVILMVALFNPAEIWHYVSAANGYLLFAAALTEVVGGFLYSLAWYIILKPAGVNASLRQAYVITMGSLFLIYTTPTGVAAEAVRIDMTKRHAANDYGAPTASVIVHRLLYALGFVTVAGFATFVVYGAISTSPFIRTIMLTIVTTLVLVFVVLVGSLKATSLKRHVNGILRRLQPILTHLSKNFDPTQVDRAFDNFSAALRRVGRSPLRLLASYTVIATRWVLVSVVAVLVMHSIGYYGLSIWEVMIVMMIAEIVSTTPITIPGMLGVLDAAVIGSYIALGAPAAVATTVDILTRVVIYAVNIPLTGSFFYTWINKRHEIPRDARGNKKS